jgi:hypothetical protein
MPRGIALKQKDKVKPKAKAQRALPVDPEIRAGTLGALIEIYENQPEALTVGDADAVLRFANVVRQRLDKSLSHPQGSVYNGNDESDRRSY